MYKHCWNFLKQLIWLILTIYDYIYIWLYDNIWIYFHELVRMKNNTDMAFNERNLTRQAALCVLLFWNSAYLISFIYLPNFWQNTMLRFTHAPLGGSTGAARDGNSQTDNSTDRAVQSRSWKRCTSGRRGENWWTKQQTRLENYIEYFDCTNM